MTLLFSYGQFVGFVILAIVSTGPIMELTGDIGLGVGCGLP